MNGHFLTLIDWKKAIVECHGQEGGSGAEGGAKLAVPTAIRVLRLSQVADVFLVPSIPLFGRSMEKGLRSIIQVVVVIVIGFAGPLEVIEGGFEGCRILTLGKRQNQTSDRSAGAVGPRGGGVSESPVFGLTG